MSTLRRELIVDDVHGVRLLHPPLGDGWWRFGEEWAWRVGEVLWCTEGDRVRRRPAEDLRSGGIEGMSERFDIGWVPPGAARSRVREAFDNGICWVSDGWLYRFELGKGTRAVTRWTSGRRWEMGPRGALVLGDDASWSEVGAAGRTPRPLPSPLVRDRWGIRWAADGSMLGGTTPEGAAIWSDCASGRIVRCCPRARPLDGRGAALREDGTFLGVSNPHGWCVREASWALEGALLGGPGGRVWDLEQVSPRFLEPVIRMGVTVATDEGWISLGWEDGDGAWFDPCTGSVLERIGISLPDEDTLLDGWAIGIGSVHVVTADDRHYEVSLGTGVREAGRRAPPLRRPGRRPERECWAGLPVERELRVGARVFGWNTDGLLVMRDV